MSGRESSPTTGASSRPALGSARVRVAVAWMAGFPGAPVVRSRPLGVSSARTGAGWSLAQAMSSAAAPAGSPRRGLLGDVDAHAAEDVGLVGGHRGEAARLGEHHLDLAAAVGQMARPGQAAAAVA